MHWLPHYGPTTTELEDKREAERREVGLRYQLGVGLIYQRDYRSAQTQLEGHVLPKLELLRPELRDDANFYHTACQEAIQAGPDAEVSVEMFEHLNKDLLLWWPLEERDPYVDGRTVFAPSP